MQKSSRAMDEAKNMALLFFVDHLMQKGGQRTIHDLSCQFGARGFTEEMRQSVGTTQEGLCEFLAQHPSLFIINDDQIRLKGFGEVEEGKSHLQLIPPSGRQRDYVAEAIQFFVTKLEKFGPELQVKSLLGHRSQAAPEVRLVSGRHLKEFADFLASQTDYFVVEADRVRLKHMPEPKTANGDEFVDEEGRPLAGHRAKLAAIDFMKGVLEQNEDVPIPLDVFYRRFCDRFPHHIRQEVATNPKELLMFLKLNRHVFFIRSNKVQLVRARPPGDELGSESGRSTEEGSGGGSERSAASPEENGNNGCAGGGNHSSQKAVVAAADIASNNNSGCMLFPLNRENLHRVQVVQTLKQAQEAVQSLLADLDQHQNSTNNNKDIDVVQQQSFLAIDFKLISLGNMHQQEQFVALIIVASHVQLVVFDLAHSERILIDSGLKEVLENERTLKVMHDVRRVAPVLANRWGIRIGRLFDTQIAHSVIQHDKFSKPLGDLRAISFINLQRVYFPQSLVMSDVPPRKLSQTPNWADRPSTPELLLAACEECHCIASGLYRMLNAQLPPALRGMFAELCVEAAACGGGGWSGGNWRNGSGGNLNQTTLTKNNYRNQFQHGECMPAVTQQPIAERKVIPLMELPMNGIYRPPQSRRFSTAGQPNLLGHTAHHHLPAFFATNGYVPPPLRKVSAPPAHSSPFAPPTRSITWPPAPRAETCEAATQTLSTGEITVLKVYYDGEEEEKEAKQNGTTNTNNNANNDINEEK